MTSLKWFVPAMTAAVTTACTAGAGTATPSAADEQRGLQTLRAQLRGPIAQSPVFDDGSTHNVAMAVMKQLTDPAVPEVDIYRWEQREWRTIATVALDVGGSVAADGGTTTTPIRTADLTPAGAPDLVVTVHYNAGPATAIVSDVGGRWHALTFHGGLAQDGDERFDVQVATDGSLSSGENDCVPNCAAGHIVTTRYRYVPATGRLDAYTNR
jgi:hypothetical protein